VDALRGVDARRVSPQLTPSCGEARRISGEAAQPSISSATRAIRNGDPARFAAGWARKSVELRGTTRLDYDFHKQLLDNMS
jgi:hypothetical protein